MLKINRTYEISFWSSFCSRSILGNLKILNFFNFFRIIFSNTIFRIRIEEGNPLYIQIIVIEILIFYLINNLFLISLTKLIISKNFYAYLYTSQTNIHFRYTSIIPKIRLFAEIPTKRRSSNYFREERSAIADKKKKSRGH